MAWGLEGLKPSHIWVNFIEAKCVKPGNMCHCIFFNCYEASDLREKNKIWLNLSQVKIYE